MNHKTYKATQSCSRNIFDPRYLVPKSYVNNMQLLVWCWKFYPSRAKGLPGPKLDRTNSFAFNVFAQEQYGKSWSAWLFLYRSVLLERSRKRILGFDEVGLWTLARTPIPQPSPPSTPSHYTYTLYALLHRTCINIWHRAAVSSCSAAA